MQLLLSPYEISASSPAATAAMLLGNDHAGVLAVQPGPFAEVTPERARELAMLAPSFARLLDAWSWTGPLWRGGLVRAAGSGRALADMIARSRAELTADPALTAAHSVLGTIADDETAFVEALSRDLIRGGSDPALSLPLVSVAERLAAESESALICGDAAGLIWKPRLGAGPALSFSIPLPLGASGDELLNWRESLASPLTSLRESLAEAVTYARAARLNGHATAVRLAAESYATAFRSSPVAEARNTSGRPSEAMISLSITPSGQAVRDAVARLSRVAPQRARRELSASESTIAARTRPIAVLRVRPSAWDFGAPRIEQP